jgi:chromosome segregation protein
MYLEKLEIQGFKSFANKNKLIFSGEMNDKGMHGLTAIVGPNGSGKSNIADAVRWVLGEQSLKNLRGKKSEDVIFSGSDKKSQLGMAEVSLYLNNRNRHTEKNKREEANLEINKDATGKSLSPFDYDEIVITRRLFRSGESEYLLNGNRVRLADIQIMLAKANVGQKTYSVIGQGMVENFLNTGAAERKEFFDEATGVKQFQIKRDQSLNKLENSYSNLQQVEMLLSEIKPRLKMLTRQVDKLKKRGQLEEELRAFQLSYYSRLWQEIVIKLTEAKKNLSNLNLEKKGLEEKLEEANKELEEIKESSHHQNDKRDELIRQAQNEKNLLIKDIARLNAEIELQLESQGQFDAAWLNQHLQKLKNEQQSLSGELVKIQNNHLKQDLENVKSRLQELEYEISEKEKIKQAIALQEEEKDNLFKQITRLDAYLEANLEAQGQYDLTWLNNRKEELNQLLITLNQELSNTDLKSLQAEVIKLKEEKEVLDKSINQQNLELQKINQALKNSGRPVAGREEINRSIEAFLNKLDKIKEESDPAKIRALIDEAKTEFKTQISSLIDGEISDKLEQAKNLQAKIINLSESRQNISNQHSQKQLELSTQQEKKNLLLNRQSELEKEKRETEEKIKKSQSIADTSTINKEIELINQKISVISESVARQQAQADSSKLLQDKQALIDKRNDYLVKISAHEDKLNLYLERIEANKQEIYSTEEKIKKGENRADIESIKLEKSKLEDNLEKVELKLTAWQEELRKEEEARQKEKEIFFSCQGKIQKLQAQLNILLENINSFQIEITRQETKQEDLSKNIEEDELDLNIIQAYQINNHEDKNEEHLKQKINSFKNQLELIGGIDPETEKEFIETNERYDFLDRQTQDLNTAITSLEKVIAELDSNIKERFEKEFKVIAEKFGEYFKILFNGGQAKIFKLEISNESEDSETNSQEDERLKRLKKLKKYNALRLSGIEIQATPPGKKIQSISMLSGGERALTAIALICAIISANPSPFVVLDEVDAALDEANSERLAQILEDLSTKTQFITITHNRASMKKASIIYGVTMKSDGVSQLLSIRLDQVNAFKD